MFDAHCSVPLVLASLNRCQLGRGLSQASFALLISVDYRSVAHCCSSGSKSADAVLAGAHKWRRIELEDLDKKRELLEGAKESLTPRDLSPSSHLID